MVDESPNPVPVKGTREPEHPPEGWSSLSDGKKAGVILAVCAVIVAAIFLFFGGSSDDTSSKNASDSSTSDIESGIKVGSADKVTQKNLADCPDKDKYFFAGDAPAGSGAMGPKLDVSANDDGAKVARDRFWFKGKCDPAWLAHAHEAIFVDKPENFDPESAQRKADLYNDDADDWQKAADATFDEITGYELRDYNTTRYDSVGMIPNPDGPTSKMPTFTKWAEQPELHLVLVVKTKHHGERLFRTDCDLQFSAPKLVEFHAPSSVPPPPGTGTPPPPTRTTTPPPPPTTPTTTPPTTPTTTPPTTTETLPPKISTTNPAKPPGITPMPLPPEDTLQTVPPTLTNRQTVPVPIDAPPVSQVPRTSVPPVVAPVVTSNNTPVPVPAPVPTNPGTSVGAPPPIS